MKLRRPRVLPACPPVPLGANLNAEALYQHVPVPSDAS